MSRYLTSTKIALLALVALYTESVVPTSATIPILSFVIKHTLRKRSSTSEQETWGSSTIAAIEEFQAATVGHASAIPGRTLWDLLLKKLWRIDSFDALHSFFDSLEQLLVRTKEQHLTSNETDLVFEMHGIKLSRTSPLGIFIRRAQIEFARLPLQDGILLWKSLVSFREPSLSTWKRRNPSASKVSFDVNLRSFSTSQAERILYNDLFTLKSRSGKAMASTEDTERILEFQIDQMQKLGQRITTKIRRKIEQMFQAGSTSSSLSHYIRFLDAWKSGDYASAFDNLHRYFDYTMHIQGRTFYQYALVNMAIMQADFACYSEASAAMQEAIVMARENKDMGCLNFCLSWLYYFITLHPGELGHTQSNGILGTDKETLSFIKSKAKESGMWSLLSTTLLGEASLILASGDSVALAFENVTRSAYLNNTKNVAIAYGNQIIIESSLYSRLGLSYMQWSRGETFLECYAPESLSEDAMKLVCIQALVLARRGRYEQATSLIGEVDIGVAKTLRYQQIWMSYAGLVKTQHALRQNNLSAAQNYIQQLETNPSQDLSVSFAISLLRVELLIKLRHLSSAMAVVDKLVTSPRSPYTDIHTLIKLMVIKATIYDESKNAEKAFSIAVRAASLAYKSRVLDLLWEAVVIVCRMLCSLAEYRAADSLLRSALPHILEVEDSELSGKAFSCLADAHMGIAGHSKGGNIKRKENIIKALEYLRRAFDEFSRVSDVARQCKVMAKRATIMHFIGEAALANDYAAKYLAIKQAVEEVNQPWDITQ